MNNTALAVRPALAIGLTENQTSRDQSVRTRAVFSPRARHCFIQKPATQNSLLGDYRLAIEAGRATSIGFGPSGLGDHPSRRLEQARSPRIPPERGSPVSPNARRRQRMSTGG